MRPNLTIFIYLIASLMIITAFAKSLDLLVTRADSTPKTPQIYADETGLKYASGSCTSSTECFYAGCGLEYCSSDSGLATTCDLKADAPNKETYTCGCFAGACAWIRK